jgi:zinc transport system substrate-binding protein
LKQIYLALTSIIIVILGVGIYITTQTNKPTTNEGKTRVVASFYPLAYMAKIIGGENVEVTCLIPYNTEVHSWQPSIGDISSLEEAEVIIYNGAGLEPWMKDIIEAIEVKDKILVEASKNVNLINSSGDPEISPGQKDPHTWVCPYTAQELADEIFKALNESDPENGAIYSDNLNKLKSKLSELDSQYLNELRDVKTHTIFVSHGAYGYLAARYGFEQRSVIGLSADEQPSTATLSRLVEEMTSENITTIFVDPVYSQNYAMTLKTELEYRLKRKVKVAHLYLMLGPVDNLDYIGQMEKNLESLQSALGK